MLLALDETSTITRIKIYELLNMILRLQNRDINNEIAVNQKVILQHLINDIERYDMNSNVLTILFNLVDVISTQSVEPKLTAALYYEYKLLQRLANRLSLSEYRKRPNDRKDIYAFIHTLVKNLQNLLNKPDIMGGAKDAQ